MDALWPSPEASRSNPKCRLKPVSIFLVLFLSCAPCAMCQCLLSVFRYASISSSLVQKKTIKTKKNSDPRTVTVVFFFFQFSSPDRQCSKRHHLLSVPFSIRVRHFQFVIFRNEKRSTDKDVAVGSDVVFVVVVVVGFAANVPVGQVGRDGQHADDPEQFGARALPDPLRARLRLGRLQLLFDAADARHVAVALHLQTGARLPRRRRLPLLHRGACPPQFLFDSVLEVFLDRVFLFLVIHCWIIGPVCLIGFYFRIGRVSKVTSGLMSL